VDIERRFEQIRDRDCRRKRRYASEGQARATAALQARATGHELDVYECSWCRGWHLTSGRVS
jgi:hypothetical protein